jgi:hypothetical protein
MKSLMIKDLEMTKELSAAERAAVHGGSNLASLVGSAQLVGPSDVSIGSPNIQINPQIVTQTDTTVDLATVIASANTAIAQAKLV